MNNFTSYYHIVISHYNCHLGIPATDIEMPLASLALVSSQNFSFIGSFSRAKGKFSRAKGKLPLKNKLWKEQFINYMKNFNAAFLGSGRASAFNKLFYIHCI